MQVEREPGFADSELWEPAARHDPPSFYRRVRDAGAPVVQVHPATGQRIWIVASHAGVREALSHPSVGHEVERHDPGGHQPRPAAVMSELERIDARQLISLDPPDHTRLRRLVSRAFTPKTVARLEPWIVGIVDSLLDAARQRGSLDGVKDLGEPVPVAVIADLVGIPPADRGRFRTWSAAIVSGDPAAGPPATLEFAAFIDMLADRRRRDPGDDLLSSLVALEQEEDALDRDELVAMIQLLLIAGQETTVDLIVNGLRALLHHPDQWQALREDPSLAPAVVEETLRFNGPVELAPPRFAFDDVVLGGGTIPAFEQIGLSVVGANRDPAVFGDPDHFDIFRDDVGHHLGFGHGIHYCLGAPLARLEGRIMFQRIAEELSGLRLEDSNAPFGPWKLRELRLRV